MLYGKGARAGSPRSSLTRFVSDEKFDSPRLLVVGGGGEVAVRWRDIRGYHAEHWIPPPLIPPSRPQHPNPFFAA